MSAPASNPVETEERSKDCEVVIAAESKEDEVATAAGSTKNGEVTMAAEAKEGEVATAAGSTKNGEVPMAAEAKEGEVAVASAAAVPSPPQEPAWTPRYPLEVLLEPERVKAIVRHRRGLGWLAKRGKYVSELDTSSNVNPIGQSEVPACFNSATSIEIRDMSGDGGNGYPGRKIELEIIEDTNANSEKVTLACQDRNGQVVLVAMDHDPKTAKFSSTAASKDKLLQNKLGYGCRITIVYPYIEDNGDDRTMIRVTNESDLFIHLDRDPRKCRFCSNPGSNSRVSCGSCMRVFYCSNECKTHDWDELEHEPVCKSMDPTKKSELPLNQMAQLSTA